MFAAYAMAIGEKEKCSKCCSFKVENRVISDDWAACR